MLPIYKLSIDDNDDSGVDYNAFVDMPAHQKGFIAFGKQSIKYDFNEEKRIVTGVMISADTPIYRNDSAFGEHYVFFDAKTIEQIKEKFHKQQFNNNVNKMHDPNQTVEGVYMIASYLIGGDKNPKAPEVFASQNLANGTWIASYKIDNNEVWNEVKNGKFQGFSVEGSFFKDLVKIKTKNKMSKKSKSIFEILFGSNKAETQTFASATTTDGVVVMYDGELEVGTAVFIEADGEQIPAPEGDHQITLEDGSVKVITLDATGIVTAIVEEEALKEDEEEEEKGVNEEVAEVMKSVLKDTHERFTALEKENKELRAEIEKIKLAKDSKFDADTKKTDTKKLTISEILKQNKK
jgi:hypothetical protein